MDSVPFVAQVRSYSGGERQLPMLIARSLRGQALDDEDIWVTVPQTEFAAAAASPAASFTKAVDALWNRRAIWIDPDAGSEQWLRLLNHRQLEAHEGRWDL